ncbi:MAG TPA: Uma2 family endonuclease [Abditibacterium sp.]|jgi:Uma2 family endonuclease
MSAQRQHEVLFTEEEYWDLEETSPIRHEFFEGQIYAMAGASPNHSDIALNIGASLKGQLRGRPCRARMSDQRIRVEATTLQTYPDVVVVCPPFRFQPNNRITLLDATVIIEILSPSTRGYDSNGKFNNYRELPTLRHYLLVEADSIDVEHRFLQDGEWQIERFNNLDNRIELQAIGCRLTLHEIYEEIEF